MKIILKRAVILGGKRLGIGRHEIQESLSGEWMFKALVNDGHIDIIGAAPTEDGSEEASHPVEDKADSEAEVRASKGSGKKLA